MTIEQKFIAFKAGQRAFLEGKNRGQNSYSSPKLASYWRHGWEAEELKAYEKKTAEKATEAHARR